MYSKCNIEGAAKDGFAFLRKSNGGCKCPPDTCQEPPFESVLQMPKRTKDQHLMVLVFCGGGGRIRTIEAIRSRFTVCPLWPLGNSPIFNCLSERPRSEWSRQTDSNPRPADYKSAALPTELCRQLKQNTLIIAIVHLFVKYYFTEKEVIFRKKYVQNSFAKKKVFDSRN